MAAGSLPAPAPPTGVQGLPRSGGSGDMALYAAVLLVFALLKAWPAPACNNPVFAGECLSCAGGWSCCAARRARCIRWLCMQPWQSRLPPLPPAPVMQRSCRRTSATSCTRLIAASRVRGQLSAWAARLQLAHLLLLPLASLGSAPAATLSCPMAPPHAAAAVQAPSLHVPPRWWAYWRSGSSGSAGRAQVRCGPSRQHPALQRHRAPSAAALHPRRAPALPACLPARQPGPICVTQPHTTHARLPRACSHAAACCSEPGPAAGPGQCRRPGQRAAGLPGGALDPHPAAVHRWVRCGHAAPPSLAEQRGDVRARCQAGPRRLC